MYDKLTGSIVAEIAEMRQTIDEYRQECALCYQIAQRLDARNPDLPGAFSGTPSERICRQLAALGIDEFNTTH